MHILYLTAEQWPTFRADLTTLFGKYLPRFGITCDLVTEQDIKVQEAPDWPAGKAIVCQVPNNRALQYIFKFLHSAKTLITADYAKYDAVQVRDMTVSALVAIVMCKIHRKPFFYWLSYPQSEGQIDRAKKRGIKGGMRFWFPMIQGLIGEWLVYKVIMPSAQHVFVQSQNMLEMVAKRGIAPAKMTPVPMGVDLEAAQQTPVPSDNPALIGKRVVVYLGTLDRVRQIDILFGMLVIIKLQIPNILLVLAGDTEDSEHRSWLKAEAEKLGLVENILWTGWLPMAEAWRYVVSAEVGLSPFPRGYLLDMASPTKAVEYMALGLPVVMNDSPDQALVAQESGAATCVPLNAEDFAVSVITLLSNQVVKTERPVRGKEYIKLKRSYSNIALELATKYKNLMSGY